MTTGLQHRFQTLHDHKPDSDLKLVNGSLADYLTLKEHHYRADRPATATRALVFRSSARSVVERFRGKPTGSQTVAVLIESLPSLSCTMRNWALRDRYGSWLAPRQRAVLLNREVRVISRVVVHPCWRGIGLAVRLVKAAIDQPTTIYTEALAAMGRVNPFFERAGMTAYPRPPHAFDARLNDAMQSVGLSPNGLASIEQTQSRIGSLTQSQRDWFHKELYRWYRQNGGRSIVHSTDPTIHLRTARQRLLLDPVYYLHDNSDVISS